MKIGYIGGGSFRIVKEVRSLAMEAPQIMQGSELSLFDLDETRVQAMANILRKIPELENLNCKVVVASSVDMAIEGADFVEITACPWSRDFYRNACAVSNRNGFFSSDNVSMTGAFLALRSAGLALKVARRMETLAPDGTLICFTNPIALLAGAVNRNTKIRSIGICAGQTNYVHNVAYILEWPEYNWDLEAEAAGINHVSWFMSLTLGDKDIMPEFKKKLETGINYEKLKNIANYSTLAWHFPMMTYAWEKLGAIHYSIEPEGLPLLSFFDEELEKQAPVKPPLPEKPSESKTAKTSRLPNKQVEEFISIANSEASEDFWAGNCPGWAKASPLKQNTGARVIKGLSTDSPEVFTATYKNNGSIKGFADDDMVECSMRFVSGEVQKYGTYTLPPVVNGLTHMLVEHQMLIADAIAQEDPDLFIKGLYAFPLCRSRKRLESFVSEMITANHDDLPDFIRKISF